MAFQQLVGGGPLNGRSGALLPSHGHCRSSVIGNSISLIGTGSWTVGGQAWPPPSWCREAMGIGSLQCFSTPVKSGRFAMLHRTLAVMPFPREGPSFHLLQPVISSVTHCARHMRILPGRMRKIVRFSPRSALRHYVCNSSTNEQDAILRCLSCNSPFTARLIFTPPPDIVGTAMTAKRFLLRTPAMGSFRICNASRSKPQIRNASNIHGA